MRRVAIVVAASLTVAACVSPYVTARVGNIGGAVVTMWVGADKFVYVPSALNTSIAFETATTGRVIEPGLMYTDGGSIPRFAQAFNGFSPWGYGPAYVIHDWIFYGQHCYNDRNLPHYDRYDDVKRFEDVNGSKLGIPPVTFNESALILAEVIKTLEDHQQVTVQSFPATIISASVDSVIAAGLWEQTGVCKNGRVSPFHIALAWRKFFRGWHAPPPSWKISPWEIHEARIRFRAADAFLHALDGKPPNRSRFWHRPVVAQNN